MKKIGLLSLAVVLALGSLGLGYATWDDQLYINGHVETGSLTLAFSYVEPPLCAEYYLDPATGALVPGEWMGKPVGDCDAWFEDYVQDAHSLKEGYRKMWIVVENAYPQYIVHTTFRVHNIGTIPVHITGFDLYDPTGELKFEWTVPPPASPAVGVFWKDFDGDGVRDPAEEDIINVEVVNFVCVQLDYCESTKGEIDLDFKQPMEECHDYYFEVEIEGVQWNKYVP